MGDGVWISDLDNNLFFPVFFLVLVSIEKIHQTLEIVFDQIFKHLEAGQKYSVMDRIFNYLLGVWKSVQTLSFVFDKLLLKLINNSYV